MTSPRPAVFELPSDWRVVGFVLPARIGVRPVLVAGRTFERLIDGAYMWGNPMVGRRVASALVSAGLAEEIGSRGLRATEAAVRLAEMQNSP